MPAPLPFSNGFGIADDEVVVEVDNGTWSGFANENGEREIEEVVVGAVGALGESVDGVTAGTEEEGGKKPVIVEEAAAGAFLIESLVLGGVEKKEVDVFDLLCGMLFFESPSAATTGAGVSVIVGTDNDLVPSSGVVTLVGISADFWGGA